VALCGQQSSSAPMSSSTQAMLLRGLNNTAGGLLRRAVQARPIHLHIKHLGCVCQPMLIGGHTCLPCLQQTTHGAVQFTVYEELKHMAARWGAASESTPDRQVTSLETSVGAAGTTSVLSYACHINLALSGRGSEPLSAAGA
jgi:hypothetical protein